MDKRRHNKKAGTYILGIKNSKVIEDHGQKYALLNDDLHNFIENINNNFDFKTFNKNTLQDVEIVSL